MKSESFIRILAGVMILVSVALTHFVDARWLFFTAFIGAVVLLVIYGAVKKG